MNEYLQECTMSVEGSTEAVTLELVRVQFSSSVPSGQSGWPLQTSTRFNRQKVSLHKYLQDSIEGEKQESELTSQLLDRLSDDRLHSQC